MVEHGRDAVRVLGRRDSGWQTQVGKMSTIGERVREMQVSGSQRSRVGGVNVLLESEGEGLVTGDASKGAVVEILGSKKRKKTQFRVKMGARDGISM